MLPADISKVISTVNVFAAACCQLLLLLLQLGKTPWVAAWDRLLRVVLRLELRSGGLSRDSSTLQEAFEAAAASQQRVPSTAPAPAKAGSRSSSSSGAAGGKEAKDSAAGAAAGDGAGVEECRAEEGELCITAPELEEVRACHHHTQLCCECLAMCCCGVASMLARNASCTCIPYTKHSY